MTTVSSTFTSTGTSTAIRIAGGETLAMVLSGTWVGTVILQRKAGAVAWETFMAFRSTNVSQSITARDGGDTYRWKCIAYTSGTITYSLADSVVNVVPGLGSVARATETTFQIDTADINGGNIDATVIGATTPAAATVTTLATTGVATFGAAAVTTPVVLTDAATIATNAALGNLFRVTLGASRNMGAPSNLADGQVVAYEIIQGGSGSYTITWNAVFKFTTSNPAPTLSTAVGKRDIVTFRAVGTDLKILGVALDD